jgi:hypothetical protein
MPRAVRRRLLTGAAVSCLAAALSAPAAVADVTVTNTLAFTRPDGSAVAFPQTVRVWCGRWEPDVPVQSIHVWVGARPSAHWELHAVVADVRRHRVVRLPNSFVFNRPRGALLFATDRGNEVNSDTEESSGQIRFGRVRCGRRLRVSFRVHGSLGSELSDGATVAVRGAFLASKT